MDPDHVHNFCANMFSITGQQIDQLRQLLSSTTSTSAQTLTSTATSPSLLEGIGNNNQMGQLLSVVLLFVSLYMMYNDGRLTTMRSNHRINAHNNDDTGLDKPHLNHFDDDYRGGDGDDMAT